MLPETPKNVASNNVVFHIKPGTGNGTWNKPDEPILLKAPGTITFYNMDSARHTIHTNGNRPRGLPVHGCGNRFNLNNMSATRGTVCTFGAGLAPGMLDDNDIHDHFTWVRGTERGVVYIKIVGDEPIPQQ